MPRSLIAFVHIVDRMNYRIGRFAMYLLFVLMGILLWSSISKAAGQPALWTLEMAQFAMVAYYILGGPYSMQMGNHVRMDLLYAGWSDRKKAGWDAATVLILIFYLVILLLGGIQSTVYAVKLTFEPTAVAWLPFDMPLPRTGYLERSPTAWRPYLWPIKLVMCLGFLLMILQALAVLIRDIATIRGKAI
ncbi:MAG: TRAP transporter small permease subunit [Pseudorhodobacter sp.]|nr:TRAP transporter small permease subunit [Pseudorhodobacter sp.]